MAAIRAIAYYLCVVFAITVVGCPHVIFHSYIRKGNRYRVTQVCCGFFRRLFKIFGIELVVEGAENIPQESGFVMVSNHQSFLDINVIFAAVSYTAFVAKSTLWKIPYFGWIMRRTCSIPVYRSNPRKNAGMGNTIAERNAEGFNYCVFPEGKRSGDGVMFRFQNGIFRIAKQHPVSILPVTLINTGNVLPKTRLGLYPGTVRVVIHPVVKPEDYADMTMEELRDGLHDKIESALPYSAKP